MSTKKDLQTSTSSQIEKMLSRSFIFLKTHSGKIISCDEGLGSLPDLFDMCFEVVSGSTSNLFQKGVPEILGMTVRFFRLSGLGIYPGFFVSLGNSTLEGHLMFASLSNTPINWEVSEALMKDVSSRFEQILNDFHQTTEKSGDWDSYQVLFTKKYLVDTAHILNDALNKEESLEFGISTVKQYIPVMGAIFDYKLDFVEGHLQVTSDDYYCIPKLEKDPLEGALFRNLISVLQKPLQIVNASSLSQQTKFMIRNTIRNMVDKLNSQKISEFSSIINQTTESLQLKTPEKFRELVSNFIGIWLLSQIIQRFIHALKEQSKTSLIDDFADYLEQNLRIQLYIGQINLIGVSNIVKVLLGQIPSIFNHFALEKNLETVIMTQLDRLLKPALDIGDEIQEELTFKFPLETETHLTEFCNYVIQGLQDALLLPKEFHLKLENNLVSIFLDYQPGLLSNKMIGLFMKEIDIKKGEPVESRKIENIAFDLLRKFNLEQMGIMEEN
ncbi:MAG: hypothetical protein ACFFBD_16990 [Candidatus Hodarchaeota archaeon]